MLNEEDVQNLAVPIIGRSVTLSELVARLTNFFLIIAGVLAFIYLLYAGILYITAGNNPDQAKKAQSALIHVIIGIIVISLSYLIVRVVANFSLFIFR
ncbi:MAG TPA: hypothetical protein PK263_05260 [bacterium]|nr:hypothetical protein [bacterium]